jgi:A/G-specific adenine glycosylase
LAEITDSLIAWYERNKRELPWRNTVDPYLIWMSEIILQQTRVDQGMDYYLKFVARFPDIQALASAPRDEVFKLWQGLGYYNRAENMVKTARLIVEQYGGNFPEKQAQLIKLPGIGPYTSAAIASIAFNEPVPVVDGNVYRVLSRIFGVKEPVNSSKGMQLVNDLAQKMMDKNKPAVFNQAMMEFGALACTPAGPSCAVCPFRQLCYAYRNGVTEELPVRQPKIKVKNRYFYYFQIEYAGEKETFVYLKKRTRKDIWKNLYDFVVVETNRKTAITDRWILDHLDEKIKTKDVTVGKVSKEYRQRLTHQLIHAVFIRIIVHKKINTANENSLILVRKDHLAEYPVPRLIEQYLTDEELIK